MKKWVGSNTGWSGNVHVQTAYSRRILSQQLYEISFYVRVHLSLQDFRFHHFKISKRTTCVDRPLALRMQQVCYVAYGNGSSAAAGATALTLTVRQRHRSARGTARHRQGELPTLARGRPQITSLRHGFRFHTIVLHTHQSWIVYMWDCLRNKNKIPFHFDGASIFIRSKGGHHGITCNLINSQKPRN